MQSCSIPAVSSENQQNEGTYAAREQKSVTLRTCTQLQCVADKKGKLIEEGLAPALPPWPGGIFRHTCDNDGKHIIVILGIPTRGTYLSNPVTTMENILL